MLRIPRALHQTPFNFPQGPDVKPIAGTGILSQRRNDLAEPREFPDEPRLEIGRLISA